MLLKQKNVFFKMEKTQNSLPGINTTARCANPPNLMFPLLRRFALFYLMIFNNISKESFEIFKTNLIPKLHHCLLQQGIFQNNSFLSLLPSQEFLLRHK